MGKGRKKENGRTKIFYYFPNTYLDNDIKSTKSHMKPRKSDYNTLSTTVISLFHRFSIIWILLGFWSVLFYNLLYFTHLELVGRLISVWKVTVDYVSTRVSSIRS